jgi:hypothetical protein
MYHNQITSDWDAASIQGAVFFPQGVPENVTFSGNRFVMPTKLPLFANGKPAVNQSNEFVMLVSEATITAPKPPLPSLYDWQHSQHAKNK